MPGPTAELVPFTPRARKLVKATGAAGMPVKLYTQYRSRPLSVPVTVFERLASTFGFARKAACLTSALAASISLRAASNSPLCSSA